MYQPNLKKQQKLHVINYKPETHALAHTFKAGSWQIQMCWQNVSLPGDECVVA